MVFDFQGIDRNMYFPFQVNVVILRMTWFVDLLQKVPWAVLRHLFCTSISVSLGIQSPSENGNGTKIHCWEGDWTHQSSAENMTGCLGLVIEIWNITSTRPRTSPIEMIRIEPLQQSWRSQKKWWHTVTKMSTLWRWTDPLKSQTSTDLTLSVNGWRYQRSTHKVG